MCLESAELQELVELHDVCSQLGACAEAHGRRQFTASLRSIGAQLERRECKIMLTIASNYENV